MLFQFYTPAVKNHLDLLVTLYTDLAQRALETMQSLSELNMQLARDLIAEAGVNTQRLMAGRLFEVTRLPADSGALQNYQRHLGEIVSRASSNMAQTAATHMPGVQRAARDVAQETMQRASEQASEHMSRYQAASQTRH
jgi:hypothetical protein